MGVSNLILSAVGMAAVTMGSLAPALAQIPDGRFPFLAPGPTAPVTPVSAPAGSREWSGESGGSGHPLMTANAIRAAAANFARCIEGLWPQAARRGVSRASFNTYTAGLTPDLR